MDDGAILKSVLSNYFLIYDERSGQQCCYIPFFNKPEKIKLMGPYGLSEGLLYRFGLRTREQISFEVLD